MKEEKRTGKEKVGREETFWVSFLQDKIKNTCNCICSGITTTRKLPESKPDTREEQSEEKHKWKPC